MKGEPWNDGSEHCGSLSVDSRSFSPAVLWDANGSWCQARGTVEIYRHLMFPIGRFRLMLD